MRLTKDQAEANRRRILAEAGQLFREHGFEGISVADLMQKAGFTHGGFYNHFASKSDLMAEVTRDVLEKATHRLARRAGPDAPKDAFATYIDQYLSLEARDNPGHSCPIATLGQDVIRQDGQDGKTIKSAFAKGLQAYVDAFANALPDDALADPIEDRQSRRRQAIASLAALIGGLVMARGVAGEDEGFSEEILSAVRAVVKRRSRSCEEIDREIDPH